MDTLYELKEAAALSGSDPDTAPIDEAASVTKAAHSGGIGDITSDAKGSGARFNSGKVPYELLPILDVMAFLEGPEGPRGAMTLACEETLNTEARAIIVNLGAYQAGDKRSLFVALRRTCGYYRSLRTFAYAARVLDYGRKKYAEWNWAKGMAWSVPLGCAVRHCLAILDGERNDPESGLPHIGHVQSNLLMLLVFQRTYQEGNDLPWKHLALR